MKFDVGILASQPVPAIVRQIQLAEALGYETAWITDSHLLARDHARGRVASALRHPLPVPFTPEDQAVVDRLRAEYDAFQHATAGSRHRTLVPDHLVELMALAGTPGEVLEQVRRLQQVPEISRVILLPQVPDKAFVERENIFRMFAEEVMARVSASPPT